jgi:cytochrome c peroxidase
MADELLKFTGRECVHCHDMDPLDEKLEKEENVQIKRVEVWHNAANAKMMEHYDKGFCGGVPFYFNEKTGQWICGAVDYETLKKWALGK